MKHAGVLACLLLTAAPAVAAEPAANALFEERVAPVLVSRCLECHGGADPKGGFDLSRRDSALAGGDSGVAIVPGEPDQSYLLQRIRDGEMPPKEPLSQEEMATLEAWIADGAAWGAEAIDPFRFTTGRRAGYDWWSLQPVVRPSIPDVKASDWPRTPVDHFILARLEAEGLGASRQADRRTLIRRLTFDLLGLPPTPEEVAAFVSDDRPDAYERLVDRLLASAHYGVRWGRAWLDVARFGESQGFERDKLRDHAWPYRDWVIDAFNADLPYDEFVRLQIAGDVLHPEKPRAVIATGLLVAGAYDEVGQNQQSAAMKAVVRQDELEDYVSVVGESFLGLTVHCARCHDHKFDPIRQQEYYKLAAALDGVRHGEREVIEPADLRRREQLADELSELRDQIGDLETAVRRRVSMTASRDASAPTPIASWSFDVDSHNVALRGGATLESGELLLDGQDAYATAPLTVDLREKTLEAWVRLENLEQRGGGVIGVQTLDGAVFDAIVFGEREPSRWMAGSDHFRRTESFSGPEETEADQRIVHVAIVYREDGTIAGYREGRPYGTAYRSKGPVRFKAGEAQVVFGVRHTPPGAGKMLTSAIAAAQLYDRALTEEQVADSAARGETIPEEMLLAAMTAEERAKREHLQKRLRALTAEHERLAPQPVYAASPRPPGVSYVLARGNPATPGDVVAPGGIAAVRGVEADFALPPDASDADRRKNLAKWIATPENPLTARVLVNRLWQHHFGAGLVFTPSDFGFNGARPTHPELLDYLASELVDSGWSVKHVQRLIVASSVYRQSSVIPHSAFRTPHSIDADNRLLWRFAPRRLEAEMLRDAILAVSGELNESLGGPGFRDFTTYVQNTQFYEMLDPVGPDYNRRTVYRTWVRSGRSRFLDVFDCPDPSTKTPQRAVTTTPLQALSLLNNSFILRMSDRMADRLRREAGADADAQIGRALQFVYGRDPDEEELATIKPFIAEHGLPEMCRILFNSNEFLYIE
jgi:mono/diheme cytochrome c family protein/cytochrome c553